ncbi:RDD family protein [Bdellovibrio bacteriovorus]|uniref:Putative metalloendopeptidase n=1 Tax=Bdellovibrio bacteriovorus (strain ATCC 15356 / DSM 50701 / NCIMB 9529 / HD100) TaxID=264462 RepID=Q6MI95_BDEBA|nr:RDD family protein [Bdellovibrio bacteriovorus]CAE78085.1 putative metalloendopeptidase [Bdellovibrio bacteriovorus HD100]
MDPFEEFEFKPLTDGLGFHKKKQANPASQAPEESFVATPRIKDQGLELIEESSTDPLRPPLPRKKAATSLPPTPGGLTEVGGDGTSSAAVDEILKTLQKNRRLDFEKSTAKQKITGTAAKEEFKKTTFSFSAALLDGMLVVAASLLCMIILLVVTKVDLIGNLTNPDSQGMIYLATFSLFAGVSFIYLTVNRIFIGCTPGEWAFDQRIGKPEELNKAAYSLKVVARSLVVIATGFVILPILSVLFNKDITGSITGAQLFKKA